MCANAARSPRCSRATHSASSVVTLDMAVATGAGEEAGASGVDIASTNRLPDGQAPTSGCRRTNDIAQVSRRWDPALAKKENPADDSDVNLRYTGAAMSDSSRAVPLPFVYAVFLLSGFAALLSDIARDRGLKGARGTHQSIYDMPYASLLPRQKHLLADAFELFLRLGIEFRARGDGDDDLIDDGDDPPPLRDIDDDDVIDEDA